MLARRKHPAGPNSLDDLCARYGIDNSRRTKHGALLDAEILAEVYLELIGGAPGRSWSWWRPAGAVSRAADGIVVPRARPVPLAAAADRCRARGASQLRRHSRRQCDLAALLAQACGRARRERDPR